jgi:hypothetical protein
VPAAIRKLADRAAAGRVHDHDLRELADLIDDAEDQVRRIRAITSRVWNPHLARNSGAGLSMPEAEKSPPLRDVLRVAEDGEGWGVPAHSACYEVLQDATDGEGVADEGDEAHALAAAGADERIHLVDLHDEACPTWRAALTGRLRRHRALFGLGRASASPDAVRVLAVEQCAVLPGIELRGVGPGPRASEPPSIWSGLRIALDSVSSSLAASRAD